MPLLATKLMLPPVRPALVARTRLSHLLDERRPLTLISAPPGFGKTTLLTEWLPLDGKQVAWLSLDADDNDLLTFALYVSAALDHALAGSISGLGGGLRRAVEALAASTRPVDARVLATTWINALSQAPADVVLTLDDYHVIHAQAIHELVTFLLTHRPPRLRLCITTRVDPPLPLSRLRARGELQEIRASDLRFTEAEAAQFLSQMIGVRLAAESLEALSIRLNTRTEGWIAGLQLAALSMRGQADLASFVNAFAGSNAYIVDYLADEVLRQQPAHIERFLLQTSILDQLSGDLCDALTTGTDSDETLNALERGNVFVTALDVERKWYRYHPLFRDVLQQRLKSSGEDVPALYRRGSNWHERSGNRAESIRFALAAGDIERAAHLIEQGEASIGAVGHLGHLQQALSWFAALPEALMRSRPRLCLLHASLLAHNSQTSEAESRIQDAERHLRSQPGISVEHDNEQNKIIRGHATAIRAEIARSTGDFAQCVRLARQALSLLSPSETGLRERLGMYVLLDFLRTGNMTAEAEHMQTRLTNAAQASGNLLSYLSGTTTLGWMWLYRGELRKAANTFEQTIRGWDATGVGSLGLSLFCRLGLADILREWGQTQSAETTAMQGLALIRESATPDANIVWSVAQLLTRLGRTGQVEFNVTAQLDGLADVARIHQLGPLLEARLAALSAWQHLIQGHLAAAVEWAEANAVRLEADASIPFQRETEQLILVRIWIAQARAAQVQRHARDRHVHNALRLLDQILPRAESSFRTRSIIEMLVLRALALQAGGDERDAETRASAALSQALQLAAPEGFLRVFVDEGASLQRLLASLTINDTRLSAYCDHLLAALATEVGPMEVDPLVTAPAAASVPASQILVEPLSPRELDVLRCIDEGLSNREIAARFIVAPSTVKWYINTLYAKLGVASRTQALARARALRLI